jgi:hypothetical protein
MATPELTRWGRRRITVELSDFIGLDATGFVDLLSGRAFGTMPTSDVSYTVAEVNDDGELVIEVCAYLDGDESEDAADG